MLTNLHFCTDLADRRCFMPIHCAAQSGNPSVVLALLDGGTDANVRGFAGATPLHISVSQYIDRCMLRRY